MYSASRNVSIHSVPSSPDSVHILPLSTAVCCHCCFLQCLHCFPEAAQSAPPPLDVAPISFPFDPFDGDFFGMSMQEHLLSRAECLPTPLPLQEAAPPERPEPGAHGMTLDRLQLHLFLLIWCLLLQNPRHCQCCLLPPISYHSYSRGDWQPAGPAAPPSAQRIRGSYICDDSYEFVNPPGTTAIPVMSPQVGCTAYTPPICYMLYVPIHTCSPLLCSPDSAALLEFLKAGWAHSARLRPYLISKGTSIPPLLLAATCFLMLCLTLWPWPCFSPRPCCCASPPHRAS